MKYTKTISAVNLMPENSKLYQLVEAYLKDQQSSGGLSIAGLAVVAEETIDLAILTVNTITGLLEMLSKAHTPVEIEEALTMVKGTLQLMKNGTKSKLASVIAENVDLLDEEQIKAIKAKQELTEVPEEHAGHA